jgi:hypothetical protein
MVTEAVAVEVQPEAFVTVKVYEPGASPDTVPVVPVLESVPEGVPVTVHVPEAGRPLRFTEPVDVVHVGCVTVPKTGVVGVPGAALIVTDVVAEEVQPEALVTVNV